MAKDCENATDILNTLKGMNQNSLEAMFEPVGDGLKLNAQIDSIVATLVNDLVAALNDKNTQQSKNITVVLGYILKNLSISLSKEVVSQLLKKLTNCDASSLQTDIFYKQNFYSILGYLLGNDFSKNTFTDAYEKTKNNFV